MSNTSPNGPARNRTTKPLPYGKPMTTISTTVTAAPVVDPAAEPVTEGRTELCISDLLYNTEQVLPAAYNQGKPGKYQMTGLKWDYTPGMKKIDSAVDVVDKNGAMFKTMIQYYGVDDPAKVGSVTHTVRVGCKCSEYVNTFIRANKEQDVHCGFAPKELPEPKKNPLHIAGLCRHLVALYRLQVQAGYVEEEV